MRFSSKDEVSRDELGALVQELVERVLGVGGWLAKEDRAGGVLDELVGGAGNGFAVRFHGELLEVGRESVKVLVESGPLSTLKYSLCMRRLTERPSEFENHRNQSTRRSEDQR